MADEEAEEGDAPVEEWRFVRDVASVVDRQNPVAMFQHGVGNYSFARLSLGIEIRESEEWNHHHDSQDDDEPECFLICLVHIILLSCCIL